MSNTLLTWVCLEMCVDRGLPNTSEQHPAVFPSSVSREKACPSSVSSEKACPSSVSKEKACPSSVSREKAWARPWVLGCMSRHEVGLDRDRHDH